MSNRGAIFYQTKPSEIQGMFLFAQPFIASQPYRAYKMESKLLVTIQNQCALRQSNKFVTGTDLEKGNTWDEKKTQGSKHLFDYRCILKYEELSRLSRSSKSNKINKNPHHFHNRDQPPSSHGHHPRYNTKFQSF